jgi:hypothetical protein
MRRSIFLLSLILAPAGVILLILLLGGGTGDPAPVEAIRPLPDAGAPPPVRRVEFQLLGEDGQPVRGAVCVLIEPELARAAIDAAGHALVELAATGPLLMMAWAPGHEVLEAGPWEAPPDGGFRLRKLSEPEVAALAPIELVEWRLLVTGAAGEGIARALLLARPSGQPDAPPWIGFTDDEGALSLTAAAESLEFEVYAPGRLARAPWLLLRQTLDFPPTSSDGVFALHAEFASLEVNGLPPGEAVELRQDGQIRDLAVSSLQGQVRWPILPPGPWTISVDGAPPRELNLTAGEQKLDW